MAAPSNLTAIALSARTIRLTWTDNSDNESEFRIEQASPAGFTDLGGVPAGTTTLEAGGLAPGSYVTFRVRARSAHGYSAVSNEASVQLPNLPRRRAARH